MKVMHASLSLRTITVAGTFLLVASAIAQMSPGRPPAVGVITAEPRPMTESTEINGRIQAPRHIDLIARVTAFLNEISFVEGAEVKKGDVLFRLESAPFEADVEVKQAALAQAQAQLENANLTLTRAQELLQKNSGTQVAVDSALAIQRTAAAQVKAAQAQLHESQISLDYTKIRSPIDGRMGRAVVAVGNVGGPTSGALATVVAPVPCDGVFRFRG